MASALPMVASRIVELGNGLAIRTQDVTEATVRARARELLHDEQYRSAAATMRIAQRKAGGSRRAVDELEDYLRATGRRTVSTRTTPGE
jgi:UDP:flavonoid glycosyltransferase YjiC (YdhE family)